MATKKKKEQTYKKFCLWTWQVNCIELFCSLFFLDVLDLGLEMTPDKNMI